MNYSKTYIGIIVTLLGWLGLSHLVSDGDVATIVDNIMQLVGLGIAIYGRYQAGGVNVFGVKN